MKTEVELPTGTAIVNTNSNGISIVIGEFSAAPRQLEAAALRDKGLTAVEISESMGISSNGAKKTLSDFVDRNTTGFEEIPPSLEEITAIAKEHELLFPITIRGIEAVIEQAKEGAVATPSREKAKPIKQTPRDFLHFPIPFGNSSDFIPFVDKSMNEWIVNSRLPKVKAEEFKRLVMLVLQGGIVTREAAENAGFSLSKITKSIKPS